MKHSRLRIFLISAYQSLRFNTQISLLFVVFILNFSFISILKIQAAATNALKLTISIPKSIEPITLQNDAAYIVSDWIAPQTNLPIPPIDQWNHEKRVKVRNNLAGRPGSRISDTFFSENLYVIREVWISADNEAMAIRQKVGNRGLSSIFLKALIPLFCKGQQSLLIANEQNAHSWDVLIQQRLKNGRPQTIQPSGNNTYEIDQFALFRSRTLLNHPVLLIGYLSQTGHCARMWLQFDSTHNGTQLNQFATECEFDGVLVPSGGERTSQWVFIKLGRDPNELIADYADRVGVYHGVKVPPKDGPSVFCTWYFHGYHYNEAFFHQDLAALKAEHLPFDVFLIDECWSLGKWGDFEAIESWPSGMKDAADRIRALGYRPGIWSCPFLVDFDAKLAKTHPEWLLKDAQGERITFLMNQIEHWVLDLTYPGVCDFLEETYRKLAADWGYEYFKFDFMRAVFLEKGQKFFDPTATRLEAYRRGLAAIRRGTGPDAYLAVCGGHYGGSLGIANSQRSGSDVVSIWRSAEIPKFRQNLLRTWMSRLWHVDPDAMMVRQRQERFHPDKELSLGLLTDDEARTVALNQYLGGGLITFCEFLPELGADRKALYRHVIPSINSASIPLDIFDPLCPSRLLTRVEPSCSKLEPWITISIVNWTDESRSEAIDLNENICQHLTQNRYLIFEFFSQKVLGIFNPGERVDLGLLDPHTSKLLRIAPWNGQQSVLAGTNLHFSGGGIEISDWHEEGLRIQGRLQTLWKYPVTVIAAFPKNEQPGYLVKSITVEPGQTQFWIEDSVAE